MNCSNCGKDLVYGTDCQECKVIIAAQNTIAVDVPEVEDAEFTKIPKRVRKTK